MKRGVLGNTNFLTKVSATSPQQWIIAHLYTFQAASGSQDYFTDLDTDITYNGNVYKSGSLRIEGMRMKVALGVSVDEQEVTIWAGPTDTLFGTAFLSGIAEGIMDGGTIIRSRAVWQVDTGDVGVDITNSPIAVWQMFLGYMSTVEAVGRASVRFKVKSPLVKLNMPMPRNFYQPDCLWSLFDDSVLTNVAGAGCTLLAANFATSGVVSAATVNSVDVSGGIAIPTGADSLPNFQRGRIIFTSGANNGLLTTIDTNDSSTLFLAYPLTVVPTIGDTFTYYPGCAKTFFTCQKKFNNSNNFRGFDRVPPVTVSL